MIFGVYQLSQIADVRAFVMEHGGWLALIPVLLVIGLLAYLQKRFRLTKTDLLRPLPSAIGLTIFVGGLAASSQLTALDGHRAMLAVVLLNVALFTALPAITAPIALTHNRHRG